MINPRWKLGAGIALLAMGLWLVPAAVSAFTGQGTFTTSTPIQEGAAVDDSFVVTDVTLNAVDEEQLGSTDASGYRLSMDGSVYDTGGLGQNLATYRGDYTMTYDDGGSAQTVSAGSFDMQSFASLSNGDVLLNAVLNESQGAGEGFDGLSIGDDGLLVSGASGNGSDFAATFGPGGGISGDEVGGGNSDWLENLLGELDCDSFCGCCGHDDDNNDDSDNGDNSGGDNGDGVVVPEPTSLALLGVVGIAACLRRGRRETLA